MKKAIFKTSLIGLLAAIFLNSNAQTWVQKANFIGNARDNGGVGFVIGHYVTLAPVFGTLL